MESEIPEAVWEAVEEFSRLAIGRLGAVRRDIEAFFEWEDECSSLVPTRSINRASSVVRLVGALDRACIEGQSSQIQRRELSPIMPLLELPLETEINIAVSALGDWVTVAQYILEDWVTVRRIWMPGEGVSDPVSAEVAARIYSAGFRDVNAREKERRAEEGRKHGKKGGRPREVDKATLNKAVDHAVTLIPTYGKKRACELACQKYGLGIGWEALQYHVSKHLGNSKQASL